MIRPGGRDSNELRPVALDIGYLDHAEGSCLATAGQTRVLCAASVENRVPPFLVGSGSGWITAEYGLLPRATHTRTARETTTPRGRTQEIRRLIGRVLRAVCDMSQLGERRIVVDCDVIQADGGTRTLAVTGGFCALKQAILVLLERGDIGRSPIIEHVAATSVGILDGELLLDLVYEEDSRAQVDMNLAVTESGRIVEIQATAEGMPFTFEQMAKLHAMAASATRKLIQIQHAAFRRRADVQQGDAGDEG